MPRSEGMSLRHRLRLNSDPADPSLASRFLAGADTTLRLSDLAAASYIEAAGHSLRDRSVLLRTKSQTAAAAALIELDGVARRIVLCPPDVAPEHLCHVVGTAETDCCVTDGDAILPGLADMVSLPIRLSNARPAARDRDRMRSTRTVPTEWVLLTSGTTGPPKLVQHSLASLTGAIAAAPQSGRLVWSTFYDIRRYGGLQVLLRAMLTGSTLVLSDAEESPSDFLSRLAEQGVTHLSGTPSHWRRVLMCPAGSGISPRYVRLSGEIADAAVLTQLRSVYPTATIAHAFASTEAGVAFEVEDGLPGVPVDVFGRNGAVELKIEDDSLRIRSNRVAARYLGETAKPLKSADGFVDTGDMLELRDGRYYFAGRRDGVINVGGAKVHPEEVESVINRHPGVRMSMVRARKSPITGAVIVADVVLREDSLPESFASGGNLQSDIVLFCREALPSHKVPAAIKIVRSLPVAETGKLLRRHA